ncbi:scavenger receptor cysteine-rich domain-containing protein DMBT1-like [Chiloscyllium punctatum]|uniref:scavenger receptor cysteine-rich domain-containing protein DMBT1-like n=1 Tax=Chiloscyllium punctatum TaxID=137246 RepID=UPI003B632DAE
MAISVITSGKQRNKQLSVFSRKSEQLEWLSVTFVCTGFCDRLVDTQANSAEPMSLRLANGGSPCAGRVEIHYRGQWGTVDHDLWDLPDAAVVCRELDCGTAVSAPRVAHFGRGSGPIVTWNVQCSGTERALKECKSKGWDHYSISHDNDAGVVCSDHIIPRLVQGSSQCFGRLEVLFGDTWKTMCGLDWDLKNANVVCAQLHCGVAVSVSSTAHSGGSTVLMGTEVFKCTGNETQLGKCPRSSDTHQDCSGHSNVTLICSDENWWPRLVNGGSRCDGRVEVYYNGSWGRVQDTLWDLNDSHVVCRQLGCGHALETSKTSQYEESDGRPWVHDIQCHGQESQLRDCRISGPLNSSVTDSSNVVILCSDVRAFCQMFSEESHVPYSLTRPELNVRGETWEYMQDINNLSTWPSVIVQTEHKEMRLVNGKNRCEGRVEVFYNKTWGTVCLESLDFHDATVICKQLHCGVLVDVSYDNKLFGAGTGPIWLGEIDCPSQESTLWQCQRNPWGQHNCNGRKDAGVLCSGSDEIKDQPLSSHFCRQQSDWQDRVRLDGGRSNCSGRVEIMCDTRWGSVCGDSWDITDANVVCRQLGCGFALSARGGHSVPQGNDVIWQNDVKCKGGESSLSDCLSPALAQRHCNYKEIASVICSESDLLQTSPSTPPGGLQVPIVVCITLGVLLTCEVFVLLVVMQRKFQMKEFYTVGRGSSLGLYQGIYEEIENIPTGKRVDQKHGAVISASVDSLNHIEYYTSHGLSGNHPGSEILEVNANSTSDRLVDTQANSAETVRLRLANGGSPCAGRVEIHYRGQWGTVDHDLWDLPDAAVVCRELDCGTAVSAPGGAHFRRGSGPIVTFNVQCSGTERALKECQSVSWDHRSWSHSNDAGVVCSDHIIPRLVQGSSQCFGRLEVLFGDTWKTMCGLDWDLKNANVVCAQLHCGVAVSLSSTAHSGGSTVLMGSEVFKCTGNETQLGKCPRSSVTHQDCSGHNNVTLICSDENWWPRLVNGGSRCDGRVEVYHNGSWGRVQDTLWDLNDSHVVCRQLGCGHALETYKSSQYEESDGRPWVHDIQCHGQEFQLRDCRISGPLNSSVTDSSNVVILCSEHIQLRVSDGGSRCAGRVEIYYNGTWGSVCDDSWDMIDAEVVCKQLNCGHVMEMSLPSSYEPGSGPVWLKDVKCSGNESFLWECPSAQLGHQDDCSHKEDVRIMCSDVRALCQMFSEESHVPYSLTRPALNVRGETWEYMEDISNLSTWPSVIVQTEHKEMRLVNGKNRCEGRVEVFYNKTWGTVCSESLDFHDAAVICKQLHCGVLVDVSYDNKLFGAGTGPIWLGEIDCPSHESTLWQCQRNPWGQHNCNGRKDAGVLCSGSDEIKDQPLSSHFCRQQSDWQNSVRLDGGRSNCSGRVEIMCDTRWGSVCGDSWDITDANVVCRQLGCGFALSARGGHSVPQGNDVIWQNDVKCKGGESSLSDCLSPALAPRHCNDKEIASVICSGKQDADSCRPVIIIVTTQCRHLSS